MTEKLLPDLTRAYVTAGVVVAAVLTFTATHLVWSGIHDKHLKADRDAAAAEAKYVQDKTIENAQRSQSLEKDLVTNAAKIDKVVAKAKADLRKTPWVMVEKCQAAGYTIQPGFGPDDYWRAYRDGRDSVLYPDRVRAGSGFRAPDEPIELSARTAP